MASAKKQRWPSDPKTWDAEKYGIPYINYLGELDGVTNADQALRLIRDKNRWRAALRWNPEKALHAGTFLTEKQRVAVGLPAGAGPRVWANSPKNSSADNGAKILANIQAGVNVKIAGAKAQAKVYRDSFVQLDALKKKAGAETGKSIMNAQVELGKLKAAQAAGNIAVAQESMRKFNVEMQAAKIANMKETFRVSGELMNQGEIARKGTPSVQAAFGKLQASNYNPDIALDIYDSGQWDDVMRLHPEALPQVVENWGERLDQQNLIKVEAPYGRYKTDPRTLGQFSKEEINRMASRNPKFAAELSHSGIRYERPLPLSAFVKAINYLKENPGTNPVYLNVGGAGLPGMNIPIPKLDLKGLWTIKANQEKAGSAGLSLSSAGSSGSAASGSTAAPPASSLQLDYGSRPPSREVPITNAATLIRSSGGSGGSGAVVPPKPSTWERVGKGLPDLVGLAISTGTIPRQSPIAGAFGAYSMGAAAISLLGKAGVGMGIAGPIGWAIGIASMMGWIGQREEAAQQHRQGHRAEQSRYLQTHVGYVPRDALTKYQRAGGVIRPFRPVFGSNLGLARTTPTPFAKL